MKGLPLFVLACAGSLTLGAAPAPPAEVVASVDFMGRVHDAVSAVPVEGARVVFLGSRWGTRTSRDGSFGVSGLPDSPEVWELEVSHPCFHTVRIEISREDLALPFAVGLPFRAPRTPDGAVVPILCELYG